MSTPEILMLLQILPRVLEERPHWLTASDLAAARRLLAELRGCA